ncbi:MAG: hypothetical protein RUMPE_00584 [Eubacteriales bacterium SKADARSKE-1]|nr:hypothetical protein [Eubacteriales bacterium SKADARSKE-1]
MVEVRKNYRVIYDVWSNDRNSFYFCFYSREAAEQCAKIYTSYEKGMVV